jgi:hypothetical protein
LALPQARLTSRYDDGYAVSTAYQGGYDSVPFQLPCSEQTPETVGHWLAVHGAPGSIVVVRHARWHLYEYHLDEIAKVNARLGRVYLKQHGGFNFEGRGISGPKGSLTLMEPTAATLAAAMQGRTWQHGKPAFKRPLSAREIDLSRQIRERDTTREKARDR